jgi:hypothetical protein
VTATADVRRLPLWRLIAGLFVLGSLVAVLVALAPVYFDNFRLQRSLRELTRHPSADETLRSQVLLCARQLDLPVASADIRIEHAGGKVQVEMRYAVEMRLPLYRVDLHFHPNASGP